MEHSGIRRLLLKVFLGFLALTAVVAIISVLSGDFGELQLKILATCFSISAASICAMACAAFIEKKPLTELGLAGISLASASALLLIVGLWMEIDGEAYWKTTVTLIVAAVAVAHALLLFLPELDEGHKWIQRVAAASIAVLALQIIVAVWGEIGEDAYYRILTAVAIIVGLETLAIPIMMKLRHGNGTRPQKLVLERLEGDTYKDAAGKKYRLEEILPE